MTQVLLSCIPLIIFIIVVKLLKIKVEKVIDIALLSFVSIFLVLFVFNNIFSLFVSSEFIKMGGTLTFIYYLFYAGISEETAKYISIKLAKPNKKSQIIITSILIGLLFGVIENYGYYASALSYRGVAIRLGNMHILFGCIMGYLLILGQEKNKIFDSIALIVPILIHTIWDYANGSNLSFIVGGILSYLLMIVLLIKAKGYQKNEESLDTNDNKKIIKIIKIIILALITLLWLTIYSGNDSKTSLGSSCSYKDLEIKVLEAEKMLDDNNNPYIRVKVNVTNNSNDKVELESFGGFKLERLDNGEKNITMLSFHVEGNNLDYEINANDSNTGYLFFDVSGDISEYKLTYSESDEQKACNMSIN